MKSRKEKKHRRFKRERLEELRVLGRRDLDLKRSKKKLLWETEHVTKRGKNLKGLRKIKRKKYNVQRRQSHPFLRRLL